MCWRQRQIELGEEGLHCNLLLINHSYCCINRPALGPWAAATMNSNKFSGDAEAPSTSESARLNDGAISSFELEAVQHHPRGVCCSWAAAAAAAAAVAAGCGVERCLLERRPAACPDAPAASWHHAAFHTVTAVIGAGVLGLPHALSFLGW